MILEFVGDSKVEYNYLNIFLKASYNQLEIT